MTASENIKLRKYRMMERTDIIFVLKENYIICIIYRKLYQNYITRKQIVKKIGK